MSQFQTHLDWIDAQQPAMAERVIQWAQIPSGTDDLAGLAKMLAAVEQSAEPLEADRTRIDLPPATTIGDNGKPQSRRLGQALRLTKRPTAPLRILLAIHMDTVYGLASTFRRVELLEPNILRGPGVTDAKGGLVVMLTALQALEQTPCATNLGWEVLINPDEEIGSPGSTPLFEEAARRNHLALLFEPAAADGWLVGRRAGAGTFAIIVHGRSAHAGRDFAAGRSAIVALAEAVGQLHALNEKLPGITVNVGEIHGGGAVNVVPDFAMCWVNVRTREPADEASLKAELDRIIALINARDGFTAELRGDFTAPPKLLDTASTALMNHVIAAGKELGLSLNHRPSGGVCDGNRLAAAGLPTVDTLGPRGGDIHSPREFLLLDSLAERAKLTALVLMKLARGDILLAAKAAEPRPQAE